jgi:hypothetical protein
MRFEDFILLRLLWHFAALRQSKQNKRQASNDLDKDMVFPADGNIKTIRKLPAIQHVLGYKQTERAKS